MVPQTPVDVAGLPIGVGHTANRIERSAEGVGNAGHVGLGFGQLALCLVHFGRDLVLLGFQKVGGERLCVEGFEELLALFFQRLEAGAMPTNGSLVQLAQPRKRLRGRGAHVLQVQPPVGLGRALAELAHFDLSVGGGDLLLDLMDRKMGQLAAGSLLAAEADEVVVDAPGFALAFDEGEVFPAVAAQASLEVVLVLAVALLGV